MAPSRVPALSLGGLDYGGQSSLKTARKVALEQYTSEHAAATPSLLAAQRVSFGEATSLRSQLIGRAKNDDAIGAGMALNTPGRAKPPPKVGQGEVSATAQQASCADAARAKLVNQSANHGADLKTEMRLDERAGTVQCPNDPGHVLVAPVARLAAYRENHDLARTVRAASFNTSLISGAIFQTGRASPLEPRPRRTIETRAATGAGTPAAVLERRENKARGTVSSVQLATGGESLGQPKSTAAFSSGYVQAAGKDVLALAFATPLFEVPRSGMRAG